MGWLKQIFITIIFFLIQYTGQENTTNPISPTTHPAHHVNEPTPTPTPTPTPETSPEPILQASVTSLMELPGPSTNTTHSTQQQPPCNKQFNFVCYFFYNVNNNGGYSLRVVMVICFGLHASMPKQMTNVTRIELSL